MKNVLDEITQAMANGYGMDVSMYDESFMQKTVRHRCLLAGIESWSDYVRYLSNSPAEALEFSRSLNITYTEFFRNTLAFANLDRWILPKLIEGKADGSELRIWSAGCASGQEPYSIAMQLAKFQSLRKQTLRYRIIATDISESELAVARKGEYNEDAIQNVKVKHLKEFFTKAGETYTICPTIRERVSFSTYDLLDSHSDYPQECIFGEFDLVFCSNLLFYYQLEPQLHILRKVIHSLSDGGYLVTGEAERHSVERVGGLRLVAPPAAIFQKRIRGAV